MSGGKDRQAIEIALTTAAPAAAPLKGRPTTPLKGCPTMPEPPPPEAGTGSGEDAEADPKQRGHNKRSHAEHGAVAGGADDQRTHRPPARSDSPKSNRTARDIHRPHCSSAGRSRSKRARRRASARDGLGPSAIVRSPGARRVRKSAADEEMKTRRTAKMTRRTRNRAIRVSRRLRP